MSNNPDSAAIKALAPILRKQSFIRWLAKRNSLLYYAHELRKNAIRRTFVQKIIPSNGVGAELGVHKGYFTSCLLRYASPKKLHLVDPWYLLGGEWSWAGGNRCTINGLIGVYRAFKKEIVSGQVQIHVSGDLEILQGFSDGYLDWAYIDSSHEYEHTRQELQLLKQKVKPDGVIAGDDWRPSVSHPHHGVCRAVREFCEQEGYELLYSSDQDKQWAIRRKMP